MKKLATIISIVVATATFSVAEASVQYFTSVQANRVVEFLNANPEILIYDANYPDNVDYVYTTDVWKEVSGLSYEVWIYGYHISTNEVVSTPVDLDYVWINNGGYPVSVARLLGFNTPVANVSFAWTVPVYRPWVRAPHPVRYYRTYYYPHLRHHDYYAHSPHHVAPAPRPHHHNPTQTPNRSYNHTSLHNVGTPRHNGNQGNHNSGVGNRTAPSHSSGMSHSSHNGGGRTHGNASMSHSGSASHSSSGNSMKSHNGGGHSSHSGFSGGNHSSHNGGGSGHDGGNHGNSRR